MSSPPDDPTTTATAVNPGKPLQYTVVGIHLAGNQTNRSAVVRSSFVSKGIWSGRSRQSPDALVQFLAKKFPGLAFHEGAASPSDKLERTPSPLIIDNFVASLGPTPSMDADQRLCQALTDLGKADFYVIDVPFELPPCVLCELPCPGARRCEVDEVMRMSNLWLTLRKQGRKLRAPLPYLDRYSDFFARQIFEHQAPQLFAEFESPMGSNRAPLLARSRHIKRWIQNQLKVESHQVIETHSSASALSWLAQSYSDSNLRTQTRPPPDSPSLWPAAQIRRERSGRTMRKSIFEYLAASGRIALGANLQPSYARDLIHPGAFLAAMSALTVRSIAAGEIFFQDEFTDSPSLLERQPLLPAALGFFIAGAGNNATTPERQKQ
jgi:hypothetical protein